MIIIWVTINIDVSAKIVGTCKEILVLEILDIVIMNPESENNIILELIIPEYNKQKTAKNSIRQGQAINIININIFKIKTYCSIAETAKS